MEVEKSGRYMTQYRLDGVLMEGMKFSVLEMDAEEAMILVDLRGSPEVVPLDFFKNPNMIRIS
jgi:hypothetical protein